jgi:hypothetical protein
MSSVDHIPAAAGMEAACRTLLYGHRALRGFSWDVKVSFSLSIDCHEIRLAVWKLPSRLGGGRRYAIRLFDVGAATKREIIDRLSDELETMIRVLFPLRPAGKWRLYGRLASPGLSGDWREDIARDERIAANRLAATCPLTVS